MQLKLLMMGVVLYGDVTSVTHNWSSPEGEVLYADVTSVTHKC